jgi:hypothetical protein
MTARDRAVSQARIDGQRWHEAREARQREDEIKRQRESDANANWRAQQLNSFIMIGTAFPDLDRFSGRPTSIWAGLPPRRLFG